MFKKIKIIFPITGWGILIIFIARFVDAWSQIEESKNLVNYKQTHRASCGASVSMMILYDKKIIEEVSCLKENEIYLKVGLSNDEIKKIVGEFIDLEDKRKFNLYRFSLPIKMMDYIHQQTKSKVTIYNDSNNIESTYPPIFKMVFKNLLNHHEKSIQDSKENQAFSHLNINTRAMKFEEWQWALANQRHLILLVFEENSKNPVQSTIHYVQLKKIESGFYLYEPNCGKSFSTNQSELEDIFSNKNLTAIKSIPPTSAIFKLGIGHFIMEIE
jgi:hypothetical protein